MFGGHATMSDVKSKRGPGPREPPAAHSASFVSGCSSRWGLSSTKTSDLSPLDLYMEGGGFHQPVSAMLSGSAGSPFRSNSGHRAPWPPPALHATTEGFGRFGAGGGGGLYSLFPGPGGGGASETSAAIYSQATSAARFAHSASTYHNFIGAHKVADSLFSSGYTFGGPTPPPPPAAAQSFSPVGPLVERGITQLELMAKGFSNNSNNNNNSINSNLNVVVNESNTASVSIGNNKKVENKRRSECALYQETVERRSQQSANGGSGTGNKRRWERDSGHVPPTSPVVKSEATSRPSCGCRGPSVVRSSPSPLVVRNGNSQHTNGNMASSDNNGVSSFPLQQCSERKHEQSEHSSGERKKHDSLFGSGGCSRTNPVSLRNGGNGNSISEWPNGGLVQIKKEPVSSSGGTSTPCLQVAEVTTSVRPHQHNVISTVSHVVAPPPMAAVVKLETAACPISPCNGGVNNASANGGPKSMQHPSVNSSAIPVGIAVARQRMQDHTLPSSGTKSDVKPSQAASCRQQKALAPAPPEPQCSAADILPAPAPPPLSAMVLQPQCEERSTNGLAPWAATTSHNPALTPPTLWQYPAHVPVQLGPSEHLPLPPVGYQLVRDPITGHFLLIPATNIEHLQRAVLWPGYPTTATTVQPSLQVTTTHQPATQHIQLFEPAEPPEYLTAPTTRILVQPQLTIATAAAATAVTVATDSVQCAAKRTTKQQATTLIKIEPAHTISECNGGSAGGIIVDHPNMKPLHRLSPLSTSRSTTTEVSVATNTTPAPQAGTLFPSGATTATTALQAHFYYEHHTHHPTSTTAAAIVQLSQAPQPSAAVQTDNGKRSQATSPVNPAETCLTPPPESTTSQSECEEASATSAATSTCGMVEQGNTQLHVPVMVQDAGNQTDTLPVNEEDSCCDSAPIQEKLQPHEMQLKEEPPECTPCDVKPVCTEVPSTFESKSQPEDSHAVDLSGLELLSNSIEQFENHHTHHSDGVTQSGDLPCLFTADSSSISSKLPACSGSLFADEKQEISDLRPADEKAAETLQMLCQQSTVNQMKSSVERSSPRVHLNATFNGDESAFSENCDSKVLSVPSGQIRVIDCSSSSNDDAECGKGMGDVCVNKDCEGVETMTKSISGGSNMLGGLGLLCALAEQRFMEEVATTNKNSALTSESSEVTCDDVVSASSPGMSDKLLESSPEVSGAGVDVNRNYKTRKSEQECKKFIANKVIQYYHHHSGTGNNSGSSSPQHCSQQILQPQQVVSLCASPSSSSAEIMDAMELNMRMKLAELQRKYREKQRELSKLTPKKSSLSDVSSNEVSDTPLSASPVKRGPGRPRKKCNKQCLDSPPLSPPGGAVSVGPRPKVGRPPLLKSRDTHGIASSQELPPPVLEKVTELTTRPRPRFDTDDDCAAPKLKASKPDILKPPTLTANRILTCAKFKPSTLACNNNNIVTKGLKLPQCNVNLVKLATNHHGNVTKVKDASGRQANELGGARKCAAVSSSVMTGELRSKHGGITVMTDLSVVDRQRSALSTPAGHTFGWKPPAHLTLISGENDSVFWFRTSQSKLSNVSRSQHEERISPSFEILDGHKTKLSPSPPPLSPSLPPCLSSSSSTSSTSSSSKKRKVGRPKKHFSVAGREVVTETIVAKQPKSKSSLVGLLLSKSRHAKPLHMKSAQSVSHKPITNSHVDRSIPSYGSRAIASHKLNGNSSGGTDLYHKPLSNCNKNNTTSYSDSETSCSKKTNGFIKASEVSSGDVLDRSGVVSKRSGTNLTVLERKPNKIRPKLKAEAKLKTWSYGEDEDGVPMDWPGSKVETVEPVITPPAVLSQMGWTKKSEPKVGKPVAKVTTSTSETVFRSRKRKVGSNDAKSVSAVTNSTVAVATPSMSAVTATIVTTSTATATTTTTTTTAAAAATATATTVTLVTSTTASPGSKPSKRVKLLRERRDRHTADGPPPAKKQKRSNLSCGRGTTSSESEDIPLSILSKQTSAGSAVISTAPCQLTQVHLNTEKQRALAAINGLFYAGTLSAIQAPDIYGITLDGERGNRPHIYSREGILQDAIIEVRPTNISELTPGTRVCAYWSQQYRCLYPGTVAQPSSPDPELDSHFVNVEFDDGDSGRINLDDIRLLPSDYPIVEYDSNEIWGSGKRRRRISGASCESRSKDRRSSAEAGSNLKSGAVPQKQVPQAKGTLSSPDKNTAESSEKKQVPAVSSSKTDSAAKGSSRVSGMTGVTTITKTSAISSVSETVRITTENDVTGKTELSDRSSSSSSGRERKRLKKRRREKLKRLLASATGESRLATGFKRHRKKHRCSGGEEHCRHRRHHKRHRKHRHRNRNGTHNKDSSSGSSSAESGFKPGIADGDALSRLSPVLEQLDILEIQQTAIRQLTTEQESVAATSATPASTVTPVTTEVMKVKAPQSVVLTADDYDSEREAEQGEGTDMTADLPKAAEVPVTSTTDNKKAKKEKESIKPKKGRDRQPSVESRSKMAAFLPARQLWGWSGRGFKRPGAKGRGKKEFYKAIQRGKETIRVGDCAVFLSTGRPDRPYIGRIESMWESWGTNMVVRVKWFYHPEETNGCPAHLQYPGALFESPHVDENDVQTISHKCEVLPLEGYTSRLGSEPQRYSTVYDNNDIYYLAGYYDPTTSQLTMEPGVV